MAYLYTQQILDTECIGNSLNDKINPNFLSLDNTIQSLSATTQTLTNNLRTDVNSVSGQVYGTGSVLQVATRQFTPSSTITLGNIGIVTEITQATPLTITRKRSNSSLIVELNGGRYGTTTNNAGMSTWFFVSLNGGTYISITGNASTQFANEFIFSSYGSIQGTHSIRYLYIPPTSANTVAIKIYAASYAVNNQVWAYNDVNGAIPVTYSITEIAG